MINKKRKRKVRIIWGIIAVLAVLGLLFLGMAPLFY